MFEHDISLSQLIDLGFVKHHPLMCSVDLGACAEAGADCFDTDAQFLARLASTDLHLPPSLSTARDQSKFDSHFRTATERLVSNLRKSAKEAPGRSASSSCSLPS